ncbi:hypothetical protein BB558_002146 [Smittium angustum]|uniref:RNA polymerase II degradation factor 1 n=1 Tax=Smittium angustum TaxID=133377 RepID=A0A2U1J9E4_SMIAN|nr:hypothetical protein BB558_002146 [Smittium angustum]
MSSIDPIINSSRPARSYPSQNPSKSKRPAPRPQKPKDISPNIQNQSLSGLSQADHTIELKRKYNSQISTLAEVFPNWSEPDLIYALEEAEGDLEITIARITDGIACQWGEVKSRKDKKQQQQPKRTSRQGTKSALIPPVKHSQHRPSSTGPKKTSSEQNQNLPPTAPQKSSQDSPSVIHNPTPPSPQKPQNSKPLPAEKSSTTVNRNSHDTQKSSSNAPVKSGISWAKIAQRAVEPKAPPKLPSDASLDRASHQAKSKDSSSSAIGSASLSQSVTNTLESGDFDKGEDQKQAVENLADSETIEAESSQIEFAPTVLSKRSTENEHPLLSEVDSNLTFESIKQSHVKNRVTQQKEAVIMPPGSVSIDQLSLKFGNISTAIGHLHENPTVSDLPTESSNPTNQDQVPNKDRPIPTNEQPSHATNLVPNQQATQASIVGSQPESRSQAQNVIVGQGPLSTYAAMQQNHNPGQYQQGSVLAMPQGPLPNDFGSAMLYGFDAQRAQMMGYYNDNFGPGDSLSSTGASGVNASSPATAVNSSKDESQNQASVTSTATGQTGSTSATASSMMPSISATGQGVSPYPQQFQQPNNYQGLTGLPYYSPFYYGMGVMQPGSQYPNPGLGSSYNQPYMKQGMFPMYPNNMNALNMQQSQLQQLSMLQQQLQMSQPQSQHHQQSAHPQQPGMQQMKQNKPSTIQGNQTAQHVGLGTQRNVANVAVGQYGTYLNSQQGSNVPGSANINTFDHDATSGQSGQQQQYGFSNTQLPAFFNGPSKVSPVSGNAVGSVQPGKDMSGSSAKPAAGGLTTNQGAAVIGGTTFYGNPQQPGYSAQVSGGYPVGLGQNQQQLQSPQQFYANYGQNQQSTFPQPNPSHQHTQQHGVSSTYAQQPQYHVGHSLHGGSQQGSYQAYNQLRSNQPYWSGQN